MSTVMFKKCWFSWLWVYVHSYVASFITFVQQFSPLVNIKRHSNYTILWSFSILCFSHVISVLEI